MFSKAFVLLGLAYAATAQISGGVYQIFNNATGGQLRARTPGPLTLANTDDFVGPFAEVIMQLL